MVEGTAICVRYEHDEEVTARVVYPSAIILTRENHMCARGFCSLRREAKCFRVDRMACVHPMVLPCDMVSVPEQTPVPAIKTEADYWKHLEATGQTPIVIGGRNYARNN